MKTFKLQSAMEYLMTYGWAILIIAIVIVALLAIGVFNSPLGTTCIAVSGYTCQIVAYASSAGTYSGTSVNGGNVLLTLGQASGTTWSTATVYFVNASNEALAQSSGLNLAWANVIVSGGFASGVSQTVQLPVTGPVRVGTGVNGYIWVAYTTSGTAGGSVQAQVASFTAKAT